MIILGIDPGTRITGYGIIQVQGTSLVALDFGCIRPPTSIDISDRYLIIFKGVEELVKRYKPEALAVETQYVGCNPQSAIKLGMARGVITVAARLHAVPVFDYAPSKAKQAVTGNGKASKAQVQGMMKHILGLRSIPEPEDAADALSIAVCHAHSLTKQAQSLGLL